MLRISNASRDAGPLPDQSIGSPLKKYLNSFRKKKISAEKFEKYVRAQYDRQLEINGDFQTAKRMQKVYSGELLTVNIEHVESDWEFFVIPCIDVESRKRFAKEVNLTYETFDEPVYDIRLKHLCAVRYGSTWCRGEIVHIALPQVTVFLVDYGRTICVKKTDIYLLKCPHGSIRPFILKCQLKTFNTDDDEVTENGKKKIVKKFNRIANDASKVWLFFNGLVPKKTGIFDVLLLTECEQKATNIDDAFLLHKTYGALNYRKIQFDNDLSKEWCEQIDQITERVESAKTKRTQVYLSHIESPTEIYVKCVAAKKSMEKIRQKIDAFVNATKSNDVDKEWSIGDNYLVRMQNWKTKENLKLWYRGQITGIDTEEQIFSVFLRDYGHRAEVMRIDLMDISAELAACGNAVQACTLRIFEKWLDNSTTHLKRLVKQFEWFAISCCKKTGSVLHVDLWATNREPDVEYFEIWSNIGLNIISMSLRDSIEPFIWKTQHQYKLLKYGTTSGDYFKLHLSSEDLSAYNVNVATNSNTNQANSPPKPRKWLPPLPLDRRTFTGFVTHVTEKGVIYLQEESNIDISNDLRVEISADIMPGVNPAKQLEWQTGDICFAVYEIDRYYRAVIKSINREDGICVVKYVDFGNSALRRLEDLQVVTKFEEIPILAHRICVPNLVSNKENGEWSPVIWKEFNDRLLNEFCRCEVTVDDVDLNSLIDMKIVPCLVDPLCLPCDIFKWIRHEKLAFGTGLNADNEEILFVG